MIWIGIAVTAICCAAFVAEVWPTFKKWWNTPVWERRTNAPKKKITVHIKEKNDAERN
jgi:hypothetical protein